MITASWGGRSLSVGSDPHPPRVDGRHAWSAVLVFDLADPNRELILDGENLRSATIMCWWCRAATDDGGPCPGVPVSPRLEVT